MWFKMFKKRKKSLKNDYFKIILSPQMAAVGRQINFY
jgi:hypothetical protein